MIRSSRALKSALNAPIAALFGALLASCAGDIVPPEPAPHVTITGGNGQSGTALATLELPLEIMVVDDEGKPVAGRTVSWSTGDVAARLVAQAPVTDTDGRARAVWILGFASGPQSATAIVTGEESRAEFTASAAPVVGFKAIGLMEGSTSGSPDAGHMCALGVDSLAWCWGGNLAGKLGDGSTDASSLPRKVVGDRHFARIFGDAFNTCALASSGELWCWGANGYTGGILRGVFGNGTTESSSVPVRAASGLLLRDFDLEYRFACGVALDGRAYCWGDAHGALGNGTGSSAEVPAEISGDRSWREIAVSQDFRCAVGEDHLAYCWTDTDFDRWRAIGVRREAGPDNVPLRVEIAGPLADVSVGAYGPCGISLAGAGTGVCWGLGAGDPQPGPVTFRLGSGAGKFVSDGYARAAIDAARQLWVWPSNCCDPRVGQGPPALLFPGIEWSDVSVANGLHAISARDSVVFFLGPLTNPIDVSSFQLLPVPLP